MDIGKIENMNDKVTYIAEEYIEKAQKLHKENIVVDAHLDLAAEIFYRRRGGEKDVIRNHFLENWKYARLNLIVCAIFIETDLLPSMGLLNAMDQIAVLYEEVDSLHDELMIVKAKEDLQKLKTTDKIGILIYMEGLDCIGTHVSLLRSLYEMGVRGASLTWSRRNMLATGSGTSRDKVNPKGGITDTGREVIRYMEEHHMFVDVSHMNDDGFYDIAECAAKPFIATHSNARTVHYAHRNLADDQMEILKKAGGIMGLNCTGSFVGVPLGATPEECLIGLCKQLEYEVGKIGSEHVGFGFDLCDSYYLILPSFPNSHYVEEDCLPSHAKMVELTAMLLERGMAEKDVVNIIGENFYRYFMSILPE